MWVMFLDLTSMLLVTTYCCKHVCRNPACASQLHLHLHGVDMLHEMVLEREREIGDLVCRSIEECLCVFYMDICKLMRYPILLYIRVQIRCLVEKEGY